jgi:hypothetical protein
MQQITTTSDVLVKKNIINRVADVPGGISMVLSTLVVGNYVPQASPVSAPASGKRTVCKSAKINGSAASTTVFPIDEKLHHFKVGDFVCRKEGGKAYAISTITNSAGIDTITVGTAIDADVDGWIYEAADQQASTGSTFKNQPDAILKNAFEVPGTTQVIFTADALLMAVVVENCIAPAYLTKLKAITVVKY